MNWPRANPGDPLEIPASLHNATIEAVEAYLRAKGFAGGTGAAQRPRQALVWCKNATGGDLAAGAVLGLDGPLVDDDPVDAEDAFLFNELILAGIEPADPTHLGKFAVLVDPILDGQIGRAIVQGVVRVQVEITTTDEEKWCDVDDGETGNLLAADGGSARILWREGDGPGTVWCLCLLGGSTPSTFLPIDLAVTGETETDTGDAETQCAFEYDITHAITGAALGTDVDPTVGNHQWVRPTVGYMVAATFGHASWNSDGDLVIGWISEIVDQEPCGGDETIDQGTWD